MDLPENGKSHKQMELPISKFNFPFICGISIFLEGPFHLFPTLQSGVVRFKVKSAPPPPPSPSPSTSPVTLETADIPDR